MTSNIKLMVDSTSDLSKELLDRYDISVVPLYVVMGSQSYKDNIDITTGELYRRSDEEGIIPKTAAPSPADFIRFFEQELEEGKQILYISMSSKVSSTNQNAHIAVSELPDGQIHIVDSMHLSASYAILVVRAARALEAGHSLEQVIKDIENVREKVNIDVLVDRLDYLYKGGRVSSLQHLIGNVLKVRPVLNIIQGEVRSIQKYRGKMEKALDGVVQKIVTRKSEICPNVLIIAQTFAEKMTERLHASLMQTNHFKDIILIEGGCVIGSHTGPGTIAVSYIDL
ncbi:DegV family protein with EDD domain [Paenibacillus sp. JGP012]|uniref:DegV family protein n=1 Tax=Paenibacillus sp. JGP012 TaxID=2735914 RepID=UPI00161B4502|nr:DegV family protein [Paenibacillus sp. JGP012]MBB6020236.1 DegV family protein with EDD domain [Paenibacillus sp. JGP012]